MNTYKKQSERIVASCDSAVEMLAKPAYMDIVIPGQYEEKLNVAWKLIQNEYDLAPSQLKRVQQLCEKLRKEER